MEQKRPRRKARAAQKRYYESIDTSYQNADPIAVQQVHEVYAGSAKTGSIIASPAAVPVAPITLDSVSGNIYEVANGNLTQNGRLGRDNRFGFQPTDIPDTEDGLISFIQHLCRVHGDKLRNVLSNAIIQALRDSGLTPARHDSHPTEIRNNGLEWQNISATFAAQATSFPHVPSLNALSMHEWTQQGFSTDPTNRQQSVNHTLCSHLPTEGYTAPSGYGEQLRWDNATQGCNALSHQLMSSYQHVTASYDSTFIQQTGENEGAMLEHPPNETGSVLDLFQGIHWQSWEIERVSPEHPSNETSGVLDFFQGVHWQSGDTEEALLENPSNETGGVLDLLQGVHWQSGDIEGVSLERPSNKTSGVLDLFQGVQWQNWGIEGALLEHPSNETSDVFDLFQGVHWQSEDTEEASFKYPSNETGGVFDISQGIY